MAELTMTTTKAKSKSKVGMFSSRWLNCAIVCGSFLAIFAPK